MSCREDIEKLVERIRKKPDLPMAKIKYQPEVKDLKHHVSVLHEFTEKLIKSRLCDEISNEKIRSYHDELMERTNSAMFRREMDEQSKKILVELKNLEVKNRDLAGKLVELSNSEHSLKLYSKALSLYSSMFNFETELMTTDDIEMTVRVKFREGPNVLFLYNLKERKLIDFEVTGNNVDEDAVNEVKQYFEASNGDPLGLLYKLHLVR